ncbi:MAG TPA: EamA family transporter [Terriglobales bacterium]|nr:EamA family transporter [Terriglobales bacterium]
MLEFILFLLIMVSGTAGELCVARAMKRVGEVTRFTPGGIARAFGQAVRVGWLWLGVLLMAVGFFSLLGVLSFENVSFVVPVTAFSYVLGTLGGKLFLGEKVTAQRWAGVMLVIVGVALVIIGKH